MAAPRFVFDATRENFAQLVLGNSDKGPVLVYFWSPKAGPCMMLMPRLLQLAETYGGKFLLVLVNVDGLNQLAREHAVNSIPTVKIFRNGQVVQTIHGAESDATFHTALQNFIARDAEVAHVRALQAQRSGDVEAARRQLAEAALENPENPRIPADLAKSLMADGAYRQAQDLLHALPPALRTDTEIERLLVHLDFIITAQSAPGMTALQQRIAHAPDDLEARYQLASASLVQDDPEQAMNQLLEIVRRDRAFHQDIGRRGLLVLFEMLGGAHPLTVRFRPLLTSVLR